MPLYQCLVPAGSLDADTRASLAEAITTVHTSVISVPRIFVNVVFIEYDPNAFFTGGRPNTVSSITATLRAGFDSAVRANS
jgi:phenylpyruvate tautomerase PptA (4-oxalocrotonate tautomerase family)